MILGIDEAGRGPWAGPLVVGAVVLGGAPIDGLTDSKKLTKKKREVLYDAVRSHALACASGWVSASELDALGMSEALKLATRRAVEQIAVPYSEIIIDGTVNFLAGTGKGSYVQVMPKADLLMPSVSAASIIAKVERDRYMEKLDEKYPGFGFGSHAGYGVAKHRKAIEKMGVTPEHRLSFAPLMKYRQSGTDHAVGTIPSVVEPAHTVSTRKIGDKGEDAAVVELVRRGHVIIERNWRTKYCEVDIISRKDDTVYFVEVKYRKDNKSGDGLAYLTPKKLKQMSFAAELYTHAFRLGAVDRRLVGVAVSGEPPEVAELIEIT